MKKPWKTLNDQQLPSRSTADPNPTLLQTRILWSAHDLSAKII